MFLENYKFCYGFKHETVFEILINFPLLCKPVSWSLPARNTVHDSAKSLLLSKVSYI